MLDGWGKGSSYAAAQGGKKIEKYNPPPIITICQFFQVMFISNSKQNTLRMVRLHKAYTKHTRKLKIIVFPIGIFFLEHKNGYLRL